MIFLIIPGKCAAILARDTITLFKSDKSFGRKAYSSKGKKI